PTALGFATWSFALSRASAGRVASLNYAIPVVAITLGWAYLGERPPALAVGGGALCLVGVYVARRRSAERGPIVFVDHDHEWTEWLTRHPSGFVAVGYANPDGLYLKVHRASCVLLRATPDRLSPSVKICAEDLDTLRHFHAFNAARWQAPCDWC